MYKSLFDNCFSIFQNKISRKHVWQLKTVFYFLFSIFKNKNKMFSNNIFYFLYIVFNYFLNIILKNDYINI